MIADLTAPSWSVAFALCLAIGSLLVGCSGDPTGPAMQNDQLAEAVFAYRIDAGQVSHLRVDNVNGALSLSGAAGADSVTIEGVRRVGSSSLQDAEAHLVEVQVEVETRADTIIVRTIQPEQAGGRDYAVDYEIVLPERLAVVVSHTNGDVAIEATAGNVSIDLNNGTVTLQEVAGNVFVDHVNGSVQCQATLQQDGIVDLETVTGDIELRLPTNTSAELTAIVGVGSISTSNLELIDVQSTDTSLAARLSAGRGEISLSAGIGTIAIVGI